jgi:hypothetical protein
VWDYTKRRAVAAEGFIFHIFVSGPSDSNIIKTTLSLTFGPSVCQLSSGQFND